MAVDIQIYTEGSVTVAQLSGEIGAMNAPEVQEILFKHLSPESCCYVIDMGAVDFISSAALRMFLQVLREARSLGGDLRLARLQPEVANVVDMIFANMVQTFGSLPGAIASYAPVADTSPGRKWTDALLDEMRKIGDPLADEAVAALFREQQIASVNRLMQALVTNDYVPPAELPIVIQDYLESTTDLPVWADASRIRGAQAVFGRYGLQIVTALFCASLPTSYAARKGVHVLAMTQRLSAAPYRRVLETAQMILDMMAPGGMHDDGMAVRSIQKVRLMHAAIRHLLLAQGTWDLHEYGYPINQEDLAGTMLTFSHVVTTSLAKLGVHLNDQEIEDFHHLWQVVGYLIGIMPELLPDDATEGAFLMDKIMERQAAPSEDGRMLTSQLIGVMKEHIPGGKYNHIPEALIRHLIGDELADILSIESTSWRYALKPMQWASAMLDQSDNHIPVIGKAAEVFFRRLLTTFTTAELQGKRTMFRIPEHLADDWRLGEPDED